MRQKARHGAFVYAGYPLLPPPLYGIDPVVGVPYYGVDILCVIHIME